MKTVHCGYVITADGSIYLQIPDEDSRWGFRIADEDESWDGGLGLAREWEAIRDDDPRITDTDRDRLGWILDDVRR